ncbi:hypothetical protein C8R42DRAFT_688846, partial [Lentinula raphanica]
MPSSRVPCVNPTRLMLIFLLLLSTSFQVIAAPINESAGKTEQNETPLWDNPRRAEVRLFFRRHLPSKAGRKKLTVVNSKDSILRPNEEMLFLLHPSIKLTPTADTSAAKDEWTIKQERQTLTGSMLYLGSVELLKHESVELLQTLDRLPPSPTSIDAMNAIVDFFLSSPRWNLLQDKANLGRWQELVKAKRDPLSYQGSEWNVDELKNALVNHNESPSPRPANLQLLASASLDYLQTPTREEPIEDSKKESH